MKNESTREVLSVFSNNCFNQITHYTYNKGTLEVSERYRKGRLDGLQYLSKLTLFYMQREQALRVEFENEILGQLKKIDGLNSGQYKSGIFEALNDMRGEFVEL